MIRWCYAFIDRPAALIGPVLDFWSTVTQTRVSARRGERGEFATLLADGTDASLKVQAVGDDGGTHLDLAVDDVAVALRTARDLGATVTTDHGHWYVMRSPAGIVFCLVPWHGEAVRPEPVDHPRGGRSRLDQVCLDIPAPAHGGELAFWRALTGWRYRRGTLPEFDVLTPPPSLPLRFLVQLLGDDRPATAHLDLACSDVDSLSEWHVACGGAVVDRRPLWTVMRDPAGALYCLTGRTP
jgi:hypothetical protein